MTEADEVILESISSLTQYIKKDIQEITDMLTAFGIEIERVCKRIEADNVTASEKIKDQFLSELSALARIVKVDIADLEAFQAYINCVNARLKRGYEAMKDILLWIEAKRLVVEGMDRVYSH